MNLKDQLGSKLACSWLTQLKTSSPKCSNGKEIFYEYAEWWHFVANQTSSPFHKSMILFFSVPLTNIIADVWWGYLLHFYEFVQTNQFDRATMNSWSPKRD